MENEFKAIAIDKLIVEKNIADLLEPEHVKKIGSDALQGLMEDLASRADWDLRMADAMKLTLQVVEKKTFPWPDCSNIKFPLITVAAMQYHARAYPTLIQAPDIVHALVTGLDADGSKTAKADRIRTHMSWQCLEQDSGWEEDHDRAFLAQPILGCVFIKSVFDDGKRRIGSKLVLPKDFVVNYWTQDIASSPRYTHVYYLRQNVLKRRQDKGLYCTHEDEPAAQPTTELPGGEQQAAQDERQGLTRPSSEASVTPYYTGEQYLWLDLNGDGYEEPYIVTFDINSGRVWRIVARYDDASDVSNIEPIRVFNKIPFIPSPDGGFYDLGLGALLGPINESVNTALNMMFDAGTMSTLGGGFVGRGFKSKGGPFTFKPNEWHPTDAPGDDLRKNILPLPVREPSRVLFDILGLLLQYGERIVSATDVQMGEGQGQNQKAATTQILNENGQRIYNAIHKRTWRAMREEFAIRFDLNRIYLKADVDFTDLTTGTGAVISPDDYQSKSIMVRPAADPHVTSDAQAVMVAEKIVQNAMALPGHNKYKSLVRYYKALKVANINEIMPPPQGPAGPDGKPTPAEDFPPPPNPKLIHAQVEQADQQLRQKEFQSQQIELKITLQNDVMKTKAEIEKLEAQAVKLRADAEGVETGHHIAMFDALIGAKKAHVDAMLGLIDTVGKHSEKANASSKPDGAGMGGMEAPPADGGVQAPAPSLS